MKILNLKFKNINSLAGEWKIDFTEPQFTDNGLFAITGKTGSGKSSILDAISLALYGKTPRVEITGQSNDVMTRGFADCYSEIVFEVDGKKWKSSWKQEKTRKENLKPVGRQIADQDDKIVADQVRSCDNRIVKILGLTFEQFTKVVMLAQGSFAAFLQADKNDKGELLEQITGTEIYGEISKKAFERNKMEVQKLENINFEIGAIKILSEEEIEIHNKEISESEENKKRIDSELQAIDTAKKWLTDLENLQKQIAESTSKLPELETKVIEAKAALQIAENELKIAKDEQEKATPVFVKVRELDTKIVEKGKTLNPVLSAIKALSDEKNTLAEKIKNQQADLENLKEKLKQKNDWKTANTKYESLVENYAAIENQNNKLQDLRKDLIAKQQNFAKAEKELKDKIVILQQASSNFESKHKLFEQKSAELEIQKTLLSETLGGEDLLKLQNKKESLTKEELKIKSLIDNLKNIIDSKNKIENFQKTITENSEKQQALVSKISADKTIVQYLKDKIDSQQTIINLAQTVQDYNEQRKLLEDGKECPLCGATEHPYAKGNIPKVGEEREKLNTLNKQFDKTNNLILNNEKLLTAAKTTIDNAITNKTTVEENLETSRKKNEQILLEISNVNYYETNDCVTKLEDLRKTKLDKYQNLKKLIEDAGKIEQSIKSLQDTDIPILRQREKIAATAKTEAETAKLLAEKTKETAENVQSETKTQFENANSAIQKTFAEYDVTTIENLKNNLIDWKKNTADIETLEKQENELDKDIALNKQEAEQKQKLFDEKNVEKQKLEIEKQKLDEERKKLFGDKKTEDEETRLRNLVVQKEKIKIAAEENKNGATQKIAETKAVIEQNSKHLTKKQAEKLTEKTVEELQSEQDEKKPQVDDLSQKIGANRQALTSNAENLKKNSNKLKEKERQQQICEKWAILDKLIGSGDGKKYRNFAQALTFEHLIGLANRQLQKMSERYILKRVGDAVNPFELSVIDKFQNCNERTAQNLSGGEKFIVSLSLALGLANMASKNMKIDTMFIDEGFGTLDTDYLDVALTALSNLQNEGKLIGVISHLSELKERIATHIEVVPKGNGHSQIEIHN
ncbi:Nuclease SbcCD subunit C [termite gut metagenome]|uniref:Nuclease SbcCD subunit C n=1 Tax=termite gut metagenome TaxID=433724 RepID=A0A5J4RL34_9ZZZZ